MLLVITKLFCHYKKSLRGRLLPWHESDWGTCFCGGVFDYLRQNAQICDSVLLHAGLTDKKEDVRGLLESRMKMSVVEQEGTTPRLNRMKTTQFTCRVRKLEENLEKNSKTLKVHY